MSKNPKRNMSVDLLRVILMFMIIVHHILLRGCGLRNLYKNSFDNNNLLFSFLNVFLVVAVNCFFLISGYYGIKKNLKKAIKLTLAVYVIYWIINIAGLIFGNEILNTEFIKGIIFPISQYWYIFVYLVLSFIGPYLNILLDQITVYQERELLGILLIIWCGYSFLIDDNIFGANNGYSLGFAIILYIIGNYIGKTKWDMILPGKSLFIYLISSTINGVLVVGLIYLGRTSLAWQMYSYNNPLVLIGAVSLFLFFKNIKVECILNISKLGRYVIYVYIFHSTALISDIYSRCFFIVSREQLIYKIIFIPLFSILLFAIGIVVGIIYEKMYNLFLNRCKQ